MNDEIKAKVESIRGEALENKMCTWRLLAIVFIFVTILLSVALYFLLDLCKIDRNKKIIYLSIIDSVRTEYVKLQCIEKTLKTAYALNKYEARYYAMLFKDLAERNDVPWELIASVVWIESKYNASAISKKNCKGLMQLRDGTAREVMKKLGFKYYKLVVWNDIMNLVLGTEYLTSDYKDKGLLYVLKKYVGGVKKKQPGESLRYENWYKSRVSTEFYKLQYVFKGVQKEESDEGIKDRSSKISEGNKSKRNSK